MRFLLLFALSIGSFQCDAFSAPLQTVVFPDGFRVDVIRAELTPSMIYAKSPLGETEKIPPPAHSHTGDTTHYLQKMEFGNGPTSDGVFQRATWSTKSGVPALMLMIRAANAAGGPFANELCVINGEWNTLRREQGVLREFDSIKQSNAPEELPLHFQVADGADGWRDLDGPFIFDASDGHGITSAFVFPRRIPELKFRVLRKGQEPQFFALKNPGYSPSFPPIVGSSSAPLVKADDLFEVSLSTLDIRNGVRGRTFRPWLEHKTSVMPENAVTRVTAAYDSTGNYYPEGRFMDRMVPLPGEHLFRLTYRLQKSPERYPWRESDADIIAEGKAGSEGSLPTASLTDAGRKLGLESIVFQPPKENDEPMYSKEPWTFMFTVYGRDNTKTVLDQMHACIFTDAGSVQKEIKGPQVGTFTLRIFMPVRKYDLDYHWLGTLKPGEAFRVGLIKKKFTEFEFIVDLDKAK